MHYLLASLLLCLFLYQIHCLELERLSQFDELKSIRDNLTARRQENEDLKQRITKLQDVENERKRFQRRWW